MGSVAVPEKAFDTTDLTMQNGRTERQKNAPVMAESKPADVIVEPVVQTPCTQCGRRLDVATLPSFTEFACQECGTVQVVPARLGPFLLTGLLGRGGMGAVYQGRDESLDRPVAVKVLLRSVGEDREFIETFRREAQAAAALNHPNIVQIYSFGMDKGQPYMAMELLAGGRFDQMIARAEPLDQSLVLKIGADVAEGLKAANDIGLVHGDVKPENILLDSNGVAKVVDFGLARLQNRSLEKGVVWGTPYYIAPEKVRGQAADARSDIYSLGATLYHALVARPPFDGETPLDVVRARLEGPPPPPRSIRPDLDPEVETLILRMLEPEPMRRYPTYASLLADLRRILAVLRPATRALAAPSRKGGKIVVTRSRGRSGEALVTAAATRGSAGGLFAAPGGAGNGEMEPRPSRKRGRWILPVIGGLVLLGLAVGGTVWAVQRSRKAKEEAAAAAQLESGLGKARTLGNQAAGDLAAAVSNVTAQLASLRTLEVQATNALSEATGIMAGLIESNAFEAPLAAAVALATEAGSAAAAAAAAAGRITALEPTAESNREALAGTELAAVRAAAAALTGLVAEARSAELEVEAATTNAQAGFQAALDLKVKAEAAKADQARTASEREAAEAERKKREAEAAAAQRKAEEQAALVARELERVKEARTANLTRVRQQQFKEAGEALTTAAGELTTEEAQKAFQAAAARYKLLGELKTLIVNGIRADARKDPRGFAYGWLVNNVPTLDVTAADEEKLDVRGKATPWSQVAPAQMARFIRRYVPDAAAGRKDKARQHLMAAVYFYEASGTPDKLPKAVGEQTALATQLDAGIAAQVSELMPEAAGGEAGSP
jgi:predicted RNA-binding Zn-ribbon protein involved in translation (DUF1610 family)